MAVEGLIPRNRQEEVAIELLTKVHQYLEKKLGTNTNLVFSRECSYGHDSFHAGFYRNDDKQVRINFRNLYGCSIDTMIEVLGHEMRHAVQYDKGMLRESNFRSRRISKVTDYDSGIWNGEQKYVRYIDAPWEIDANKYQRKYADDAIKALGIKKEVKTIIPMGSKTEKDEKGTYDKLYSKHHKVDCILLSNTWIKNKKITNGGGIAFVLKSSLPEGFDIKNREDNAWLYEQQHLLQFIPWIKASVPFGGFKLSQLIF